MEITEYKKIKKLDTKNKTENVKVLLVNGTPALRIKKHHEVTQEYMGDDQIGISVDALKLKVKELQNQIDNLNELIADAEALT